jgi:hypothetical protein
LFSNSFPCFFMESQIALVMRPPLFSALQHQSRLLSRNTQA